MASSLIGSSLWVRAWLRAVALPAWRRAAAVWASLAIIAAIVMGPTGLMPGDVVDLLLHNPRAAALIAALWVSLFHPVARILVRAEAARFLQSLPAPRLASQLPLASLAVMQLPPLLLFWAGEEAGWGLAVWGGCIAISYLATQLRLPPRRPRALRWTSPGHALRAVLASRLLTDDALLRGFAFAGIAGIGASLMIRNNQLVGPAASTLGLGTVVVLGTPAWAAVIQPLAVTHRRIWPLCTSAGMSPATWLAGLAVVLTVTLMGLCAVAALIAAAFGGLDFGDVARITGAAVGMGAALGLAGVRVGEWATRVKMVAERTVSGTLVLAAGGALLLGVFGELGILAALALAIAAAAQTREPTLC